MKVGLCGFTMAQARYAARFPVLEVQQTFYQPPAPAVLDRWRTTMPSAFEFTLKAWQLITHRSTSATYRRLKRPLSERERAEAGSFSDSEIVDEAWLVSVACAERLRASAILFQCPASFRPTSDNVMSLRRFMNRIDRPAGLRLLFEPRGPAWTYELARPLCDDLGLVYVVDPFVTSWREPGRDAVTYFRLHGITGARYAFSDSDLDALIAMLPSQGEVYVLFNNIPRVVDAQRFLARLARQRER